MNVEGRNVEGMLKKEMIRFIWEWYENGWRKDEKWGEKWVSGFGWLIPSIVEGRAIVNKKNNVIVICTRV